MDIPVAFNKDTFNSVLKAVDGEWIELIFLTPFKRQTLLTDTNKRGKIETFVYLCFVYVPADKTVRLFRIGLKLFRDIQLIGFERRERKIWLARGVRVGTGPFWSYQIQADLDREVDIDLTVMKKESLERLGILDDLVDLRNRGSKREMIGQQLVPGRILDF